MSKIEYVKGDIFAHLPDEPYILAHCCNDRGLWGHGFVIPLAKRFPRAEEQYRERAKNNGLYLGLTQFVNITKDTFVANLIAQSGIFGPDNPKPIRYAAIAKCLEDVSVMALSVPGKCVIAPKFGAGLARGDWTIIEALIEEILLLRGIRVTIFSLD